MKNKNEILKHLVTVGYTRISIQKIAGFLLRQNIVEKGELVSFKSGERIFDDFYEWFNKEEVEVIETRGSYIDVVKKDGETTTTYLCLSNIVDNKVLVYNGTGVVICDLEGLKWDISSDKNMEEFMLKMADAGFGYLDGFGGFFLLDELEIEECEE